MDKYIIVKKLKNGLNERIETNSFIKVYNTLITNSDCDTLRLIKKINGDNIKGTCVVNLNNFELSFNFNY